jgi:hypothetical protein
LIHRTPVLDNEAWKFRSELLKRGSLASRHSKTNTGSSRALSELPDADDQTDEPTNSLSSRNDEDFYGHKINKITTNIELNYKGTKINEDDEFYSISPKTNYLINNYPTNSNGTQSIYSNSLNGCVQPVEEWSCEQVEQWLIVNDLSMYANTFAENSIDGSQLIDLDTAKLKVCQAPII